LPSDGNGVSGVVRIPLQIILKGVLSFRTKWCADFSNTPLLSCGFVAFRVGVWNSALCEILLLLNRRMNPLQIATVFPQVRSLKFSFPRLGGLAGTNLVRTVHGFEQQSNELPESVRPLTKMHHTV
jgi:hypothetical protein